MTDLKKKCTNPQGFCKCPGPTGEPSALERNVPCSCTLSQTETSDPLNSEKV